MQKKRLFFIDNIRILLMVLVILQHLSITYGGPGPWYYREGTPGQIEFLVFALFQVINQSFFMGFFFMISAYFTPGSYDRKGAWDYLKDRLLRLGIPLLFYITVIDPIINYVLAVFIGEYSGNFPGFIISGLNNFQALGTGPLWFIEALLIFEIVYILCELLSKRKYKSDRFPSNKAIALFALLLACITFIVRIWLPMGWNFKFLNLQFPYFTQYIGLYIVGLAAYRGNWLMNIPEESGRLWRRVAIVLAISLPIVSMIGAPDGNVSVFVGGFSWQSFVYPLWEQFFAVSIIITLLVLFRNKFNNQGKFAKAMSGSVYTAYIIHAPVLVFLTLSIKNIIFNPLLKFILVAPVAVAICFLSGNYIRKLSVAKKIL